MRKLRLSKSEARTLIAEVQAGILFWEIHKLRGWEARVETLTRIHKRLVKKYGLTPG